MNQLTAELNALILSKKHVADAMSLTVYNECGVLFHITRNMSDPNWFVQFTVPTMETIHEIFNVVNTMEGPTVQAKWIKPILLRTEAALKYLLKTALSKYGGGMSNYIRYVYTQGDATPPRFAELRGCAKMTPTDDANELALRKYYQESCRGEFVCTWFDTQNYVQKDLTQMLDTQYSEVIDIIRVLVAEA